MNLFRHTLCHSEAITVNHSGTAHICHSEAAHSCHSEAAGRRISVLLFLTLFLLLALSCKRMPLYNRETNLELDLELNLDLQLDLDLDIDVDIELEMAEIKEPEYFKTNFYDPKTGQMIYNQFVGTYGGALSLGPGRYIMLVYSFGTEYVQVRGENDLNTIEAFTSDITDSKLKTLEKFPGVTKAEDPLIIYAPDHLLVTRQEVEIPEFSGESRTITISSAVQTIVETYIFEVHTVVGAEYIESAEAFVTNQARSTFFGKGEVSQDPATIWFPIGVDKKKGCLYTVFNTFGKLPGTSESYLHIFIRDTGGHEYTLSVDITDQFDDKDDHHIIIEEPMVVPEPESNSGGIAPTVDPWKDEIIDVPIG